MLLVLVALVLASALSFIVGAYLARKSIWPFAPQLRFALPDFQQDKAWVERLRVGGYILFFRHAQREKWLENTAFDAVEVATNAAGENTSYRRGVCLTEQGVEESKIIGEIFRLAGVKVGQVLSSPSCRARQTAMHAFGKIDTVSASLLHRIVVMKDQHRDFALALRQLMDGVALAPGTNAALVSHTDIFQYNKEILLDRNETGADPDDRAETGFVIFEKQGAQLVAKYKFRSISHFANSAIPVPLKGGRTRGARSGH